ncbi:hypothetical protein SKAU_G00283300 [Synaphobranchus kaupii]|uniref:Somatostatin/Cortistatin C-terminal domain-containing protein n=1 Tax=Synaphobranchus kaupii TaxID=118154 RepID=A0A9Q1IN77_SYNKA|nr:hypothetical protein SKAU_G00283300 [Synaphobranchus kaupii]
MHARATPVSGVRCRSRDERGELGARSSSLQTRFSPCRMHAMRSPAILALLGLALALCSPSVSSQPTLRYRRLLQNARAAAAATQVQREQIMAALLSQAVERRGVSTAQRSGTPAVQVPAGDRGVGQVSKAPAAGRGVAKDSKVPSGNKGASKVIQVPARNRSVTKVIQVPAGGTQSSIGSIGVVQESKIFPLDRGAAQESEIGVPEVGVTAVPNVEVSGVGVVQESEASAVGLAPENEVPAVGVVVIPEITVSEVSVSQESGVPGVAVAPEIEVSRVGVLEESDAAPEMEVFVVGVGVPTGDRGEGVVTELEHGPDVTGTLPPRERKAGCKSFYWKSFTSC